MLEPPPRLLTRAVRKRLGLPPEDTTSYRWAFAALIVAIASVPLLLAGYRSAVFALVAFTFVILPGLRWYERRELRRREAIYIYGNEALGTVLDVEPGGVDSHQRDRTVRIEFWVEQSCIRTSVLGCHLARQGLAPGDDVLVLYKPSEPTYCLITQKTKREIIDAV